MKADDPSDTFRTSGKSRLSWLLGTVLIALIALAVALPAGHALADRDDDDDRVDRRESREFDEDDFEERERRRDRDDDEEDDDDEDDEDFDDDDDDYEEEYEEEIFEQEIFLLELEMFERLITIVHRTAEVNMSPQMSAIAAVMAVDDHVEESDEVIEFLEPLLRQSKDSAVKRAIRFKLIDAYRDIDQPKEAMDHMKSLILMED